LRVRQGIQKKRLCLIAAFVAVVTTLGCDGFPNDPSGSLREAQQNGLRVGVIHAPPWADVRGQQPEGIEIELVRRFAESIGARVEWMQGEERDLMLILQERELHLVVGGVTKSTPWARHVGLTDAYKKEKVVVCSTTNESVPKDLEEIPVSVKRGEATAAYVKQRGGRPVAFNTLTGYQGLVAAPERDANRLGCGKERLVIETNHHVIAIPKGENGLLMKLEEYLNAAGY
jgi:polar amino acid transport system substrate-binding protein